MPVHGGRFGELVLETHDEAIAHARLDQRPWQPAVVGPRAQALAGRHLDLRDLGHQLDLDNLRIRIYVRELVELEAVGPASRRKRLCGGVDRAEQARDKGKSYEHDLWRFYFDASARPTISAVSRSIIAAASRLSKRFSTKPGTSKLGFAASS